MHSAPAQRQSGQKAGLTKLESLIEIPIAVRPSASSGARGVQAVFAVHNLGVTLVKKQNVSAEAARQ